VLDVEDVDDATVLFDLADDAISSDEGAVQDWYQIPPVTD
jgi:hypothetical protein